MKPANSPTQGQPNPRKTRLKVAFWATFFPQQVMFSWAGIDFIYETDYNKPAPTKFSANTPMYKLCILIFRVRVVITTTGGLML